MVNSREMNSTNPTKSDRSMAPHGNRPLSYNWVLAIGITMILLGVLLFAFRAALISLVIMIIGISLFTVWLYLSTRLKESKNLPQRGGLSIRQVQAELNEECICAICKHKVSSTCLSESCACCILMKDDSVVGHSNNPLQ
jgi:hypothetical protein